VLLHSSLCRGLGSLTTFLPMLAFSVKDVIHYAFSALARETHVIHYTTLFHIAICKMSA
jgi:hypothetical protein